MLIVPFQPGHLHSLNLQKAQASLTPTLTLPGYAEGLATAGPCYSAVDGDDVYAAAGFFPQWENRAIVWALVSESAGKHFVKIHRAVLRSFALHPYRRLETCVVEGFDEGHRWAKLLGFELEGKMRSWTPDGRDAWMYSRIS